MDDLISRQAAIDAIEDWFFNTTDSRQPADVLRCLPAAQPEPAIPISRINKKIEWLKSIDNSFAALMAEQISVMVKTWEDEQDESTTD